ncbi:bile salt-activated lipase-like isoform X1 [Etheostoma cragini]|uniref:bile salt-activated lipase-like isoform X1 n=1 Tax=Etheostoma cragini TaxID=417921 RepID=UPI00155E24F6|nr:bile salt-activated lipase-like isoform X1 [Etheostoma cragini]XP_034752628.1 bile salt-activated lipase-like isoform X1 [Etheostoma cragini]
MEKLKILFAAVLSLGMAAEASLGVVQTEGGSVQGQNIPLGLFRSVDVFKGIPFAAKPGTFEKPKPHPGWDGILKATKFAQRCLQMSMLQTSSLGSEDCLYLNIWVPHGQKVSSNLPVMIWLYGGGFFVGGSMGPNFLNNYLYSGQEIADKGNVIVVSVGYRVGTLGFLSTGDSRLPGNYGLWDQHAAIAWVNRNIRSFGGDPDNITIFGESAGAASVSFQTLSPHSKGLFKRAISQSGVAFCPWALNRNPRKVAEEVAETVGCPTDDRMEACLKSSDAVALTMAAPIIAPGSPDYPGAKSLSLSPVVDGDFLPDQPGNLFHNAAETDYLAGVNNMDGHQFTSKDIPSLGDKNQDTIVEDVKRLLTAYTKETGQAGFEIAFAEYSSNWGSTPTQTTIETAAVDIGTDYLFLVPTQTAIVQHSANAKSGRTFSYLLSEPSLLAGPGKPYHDWVGADHADDLQYVFGKPFTTPKAYGDRQRDLSGYIIAYWTNFARTGNPNIGNLKVPVTWPQFTSTGQQFLDINAKMNASSVGQELRQRFVHLWTSTLPSLPSHAQ